MGSNIKIKISPNIFDSSAIIEEILNGYIHLNRTTQYILRCSIYNYEKFNVQGILNNNTSILILLHYF